MRHHVRVEYSDRPHSKTHVVLLEESGQVKYHVSGWMTVMRTLTRALNSGHWPSLLGAWLHFEVSFMVWLLIGALGVFIAEEFGLTATQKGFLVAVPLLSGALLRVPVGASSDIFGPKSTGLVILVCEFFAVLWGWKGAGTYGQVLGVGLALGVAGASFAVALPLASRAYPLTHQGLAMGVAASANSGTVLAAFFAPRFAEIVGWHGVFGIMAIAHSPRDHPVSGAGSGKWKAGRC